VPPDRERAPLTGVTAVSFDVDGTGNAGLQTGIAPRSGAKPTPLDDVKAVSFDVDGTLYSDRFLRTRVAWEAIRRRSLRDLRALRKRRDPSPNASARLAAEARILIPVIRRLGPRPGVAELLDRLRQYTLIAVSDFAPETRLEALGLGGVFERVYAAERHGTHKPNGKA